jgi:hypothetical protein
VDPGRLAITVTSPDGSTRWAYDESDPGAIPLDITTGTSTPGGFKDFSCSLLRDLTQRPDEGLFDTIRAYGPGNQTAWEGRVAQLPRQTGPMSLQPGGVGWGAHLEDNATFMEVYVARGSDGWGEAPLQRRVAIAAGGASQGAVPVATGGGLIWTPVGGQALGANEKTELFYIAPAGRTIAKLQYLGAQAGTWTSFETPTFFLGNIDLSSSTSAAMTLDSTKRTATPTAARYAMLRSQTTAGVTPGAGMSRALSLLAVYGNHGLTLRTTVAGEPDGVYASDVVADVLTRAAPLLTYTTGATGTVQPTTFAIPHLSIDTPSTAADVIARANAYHSWDWLVWEDKTFYYQPAGTGTEWLARIGDGASLSLEGDTAEQIINGVVVAYQDNGVQKYAGPTGSGLDVTSASLVDADVNNPATEHGITKWVVLSISVPTTDAGAVQLGAIYLAERNLASRRGQMTLKDMARHPQEGMVPVWRIRAGDTVKLTDRPGDPARRIVETSYSHSTRTVVLTLDSTAHKLDALIERLAVVTGALTG